MNTEPRFFYCYNKELYEFIKSKDIRYLTKARRLENNDIFAMYLQTEELTKAINEYKETRTYN